jgi:hypothetical protein
VGRLLVERFRLGAGWFRIWIVVTALWSIGFIGDTMLHARVDAFPSRYLRYVPDCPTSVNVSRDDSALELPYSAPINICSERVGLTEAERERYRQSFEECQAANRISAEAAERTHQEELARRQAAQERRVAAAQQEQERLRGTCMIAHTEPSNGLVRSRTWREVLGADQPNAETARAAKARMRSAQASWIGSLLARFMTGLVLIPAAFYMGLAALLALTRWIIQGFRRQ